MTVKSNLRFFPVFLALVLLLAGSACNPASSNKTTTTTRTLTGVSVGAQGSPAIALAGTVHLVANGSYHDAKGAWSEDVTASTTWTTSDETVATVDHGLVTGTGVGTTTISASFGGKSGSITIFVGLAHSMALSPAGPFSLAAGSSVTFYAIETLPDGSTLDVSGPATWDSSHGGIVSIYPYLGGDATLVATGTTTITATLATGEVATLDVTVVP